MGESIGVCWVMSVVAPAGAALRMRSDQASTQPWFAVCRGLKHAVFAITGVPSCSGGDATSTFANSVGKKGESENDLFRPMLGGVFYSVLRTAVVADRASVAVRARWLYRTDPVHASDDLRVLPRSRRVRFVRIERDPVIKSKGVWDHYLTSKSDR